MNARKFGLNVLAVIGFYGITVGVLFALRQLDPTYYPNAYATFKDATLLLIAIPAAWLGYCLQRRQAYLKDVRDLWSKLVAAVQGAIQYTHLIEPPQTEYAKALANLSIVTEELRAVFSNVGEAEGRAGLYPFERIKEIYGVVSSLGFGAGGTADGAKTARAQIVGKWKQLRAHFLTELERGTPARPDSPFLR